MGGDVDEMRIHRGPGYRLYLTRRTQGIIIPPCVGDKGSQARDMAQAQDMAKDVW